MATREQFFIDKKLIKELADGVVSRALKYIGNDLRAGIRKKLRARTKTMPHSLPGQPPRIDGATKSPLKNLVNFVVDDRKKTVVAGPMVFHDSRSKSRSPVPSILEKGGIAMAEHTEFPNLVHRRFRFGKGGWYKNEAARKRARQSAGYKEWRRARGQRVVRPVRIAPRPFVSPTLEQYLAGDGVRKAIMRARGQTKKKGYDSAWSWK